MVEHEPTAAELAATEEWLSALVLEDVLAVLEADVFGE